MTPTATSGVATLAVAWSRVATRLSIETGWFVSTFQLAGSVAAVRASWYVIVGSPLIMTAVLRVDGSLGTVIAAGSK